MPKLSTKFAILFVLLIATSPIAYPAEKVRSVSDDVRKDFQLDPFYKKCVSVEGLPIVSSEKVNDAALLEAAWLIKNMVGHRPEILRAMAKNKVRFTVMAFDELTTDVPEHSDLKPKEYWDRRARGLGATEVRPSVSCGEENLLKFPGDPYSTENILIHEFGHAIHQMGLSTVDPAFDGRLKSAYESALAKGLWKGSYAATNKEEYWAEGVQSWFDTNRENDSEHNAINTRAEIKKYDPELSKLLEAVFEDKPWRYTPPEGRMKLPHLKDYNATKAPHFAWPKHLKELKKKPAE